MSKAPVAAPKELPEEGEYKANVIYVIDIGTQKSKDPNRKDAHIVLVGFELCGTKREDGTPHFARQRYTYSSDERSNLSKDLRRAWKVKDPENFDLESLRGKSCVLEIVHSEDKQYANIEKESMNQLKGACPKPVTKFKSLFLDETFDQDVYDSLPDKLKEAIAVSPEYDDVMLNMRKPKKKVSVKKKR